MAKSECGHNFFQTFLSTLDFFRNILIVLNNTFHFRLILIQELNTILNGNTPKDHLILC